MSKLKMAVFGSGHGFSTLIPAALTSDQYEIYAAESRFPIKGLTHKLSSSVKIESRTNLLQNGNFDISVIAVPPFEQLALAKELVKNSRTLYIEKPAGLNSFEARELVNLAEEKNCKIYVGYQFRFDPAIQHFKKLMTEPQSQLPNKISINWHTSGSSGNGNNLNWRNDFSKGGGVRKDFLGHVVDYLVYLFGARNLEIFTRWNVIKNDLNNISLTCSNLYEIEINISRGVFSESFWEIKHTYQNREMYVKHSVPFSFNTYSSNDLMFLESLHASQQLGDVRIQSTARLFEAISKILKDESKITSAVPTIHESLVVHQIIEGIFESSK